MNARHWNQRPMNAEERRMVAALSVCTSSMLRRGGLGKAARVIVLELRDELSAPVPHITSNISRRVYGWYMCLMASNHGARR